MPKREDIKKILIIGSGPIIIGQACEFDYSGTQACKALKEEGYEVVLVNSNPATIMTDPEMADRTYIEPITWEIVADIIEKERPDALLPTLGGQTGLNVTVKLKEEGVIDKYDVEIIGANYEAIKKAETRELFREAMERIGLSVPKSGIARSLSQALDVVSDIGFPVIIRPSFTLGGTGGGIAYNIEEFIESVKKGLSASMIGEVLIEEFLEGWKEYELEVMRDKADNVVIICSIENFDPMGIHTGDSITVAPAQTLTDKEYQLMRDAAISAIREIGVETGGSNIQFAINPKDGKMVIIEMNPRVSRSSALASKATGFPIAKIAAKLAVGYTLYEIPNDITKKTPASFEPTIDYCVVKIPKFNFEKFKGVSDELGVSMRSVGEVMAIGRTFKEALQKGIRSLEVGKSGLCLVDKEIFNIFGKIERNDKRYFKIRDKLIIPNPERIFYIRYAIKAGFSTDEICELTKIDRWFIENIKEIVELEKELFSKKPEKDLIYKAKRFGFSDRALSFIYGLDELSFRDMRKKIGISATFKLVDTCAAEFEAETPYYYSTYEIEDESRRSKKEKIMILGGGPNRIGQGIEFDYCCVHAAFALKECGFETIMVNSNPETVSTDFDTSDKLYFEPLTLEDVLNIVDAEKPKGVIIQFGGQTPLNLALPLKRAGVNIIGTRPEDIDRAEDREKFTEVLNKIGLLQAPYGTATSLREAKEIAKRLGYPVLVRPSYVLGGRAMEIVYDEESLCEFMEGAIEASRERPVLVDKFLEDAIEVDVDAVSDGKETVISGIMEHIEEAGIHSGDSACVIPPIHLGPKLIKMIREATYEIAKEVGVLGLINIQYAIKDGKLYVLEVNPRASRTVPFVSKATGIPWAKVATKVMIGKSLKELGVEEIKEFSHVAVKEAVFPFNRFPGVDPLLGPEMRSTGEVMGIDKDFGRAYAKAQIGAGQILPTSGKIFISVNDRDKKDVIDIAKGFSDLGFFIISTSGTGKVLKDAGINVEIVHKIYESRRPNVIDYIKNNMIDLIINTPSGKRPRRDQLSIRSIAVMRQIPYVTTISGARATLLAIISLKKEKKLSAKSLQEYHK